MQRTQGLELGKSGIRIFTLLVALLLVALLAACGGKATPTAPHTADSGKGTLLGGTDWALTPLNGAGLPEAILWIPTTLPDGDSVKLEFTLINHSETGLYVLKWYTPLEGTDGEISAVKRDGQVVPYVGILAMRGDPTPEGYVLLEAGQSVSAEVDLATAFDFSQPGEYTIEFLSPRISHVAQSEAEMTRSVDELGPVSIRSSTVTVEIGGPSSEGGKPPPGDDVVPYHTEIV